MGSVICDHCKKEFEPRRQGRRQRFCPGGKCRRANDTKARRLGVKMLRRRALKHSPRTPAIDEKLSLFKRSILIAQQLEAEGHEVEMYTRYSGEIHVEHWPGPTRRSTDMATYLVGGMINLVTEDGKDCFEHSSTPSRASFNEFQFFVDGKSLSMDEAAALLAAAAEPAIEKQADDEGAEMVTRETAAVCDINA